MECWLDRFARLNELHKRIESLNVLNHYIRRGEADCLFRRHAELLEELLARLEPDAWQDLVGRALQYSYSPHRDYGWRQFWNTLNEARGYALLKDLGYSNIQFIPEIKKGKSKKSNGTKYEGKKSAELIGESLDSRAIVEVKTINLSNEEIERTKKCRNPSFSVAAKMGSEERPGDIRDLQAFAGKLIEKADPVSVFLWGSLDRPAQEALAHSRDDPKQLEILLIDNLNRIIKGPCIYDAERFCGVRSHFQDITNSLLENREKFPDSACLNRCLLDDAYPQELDSWSQHVSGIALPNAPIFPKFKEKLRATVAVAGQQIKETLDRRSQENKQPVKKIVLLIVNRDFGSWFVSMKELQTVLQQPDLEVVCQLGDV